MTAASAPTAAVNAAIRDPKPSKYTPRLISGEHFVTGGVPIRNASARGRRRRRGELPIRADCGALTDIEALFDNAVDK
jgi:hypothetical protein